MATLQAHLWEDKTSHHENPVEVEEMNFRSCKVGSMLKKGISRQESHPVLDFPGHESFIDVTSPVLTSLLVLRAWHVSLPQLKCAVIRHVWSQGSYA